FDRCAVGVVEFAEDIGGQPRIVGSDGHMGHDLLRVIATRGRRSVRPAVGSNSGSTRGWQGQTNGMALRGWACVVGICFTSHGFRALAGPSAALLTLPPFTNSFFFQTSSSNRLPLFSAGRLRLAPAFILARTFLRPVWIRKPTFDTDSSVTAAISR